MADYLENRTNLCLVFALIDSGLAPQEIDLEFVEWLVRHAVPFVLVFTKTDKVSAPTVQANIAAFTDRISAWFEKLPAVFTCSAETRQGRQELLGVIDEQMTAINAASRRARVQAENPKPAKARFGKPKTASRPKPPLVRSWPFVALPTKDSGKGSVRENVMFSTCMALNQRLAS